MDETNNIIEAKYINIKWADQVSARRIKESIDSIPIIKTDVNSYELEVTTFPKINLRDYGQLAFRVLDDSVTSPPFFLKANGDKSNLIKVKNNDTNKIWWVEGETWSKSDKWWQSEAFRSAGNINLCIGSYNYLIKIGACTFSYEQLSKYLQDFKNDLWYLILHETSYITAPVNNEKKVSIIDEESIKYFDSFNEFASKVVDQPKSELREVQELKSIKQVRPIPRTFMEIATMGYRKQLTSRAYQPTFNVPENQYVLFIANRIITLLKNLGKVTGSIDYSLNKKNESQKERLISFSNIIKINRNVVVSEYKNLQEKVKKEKKDLVSATKNQNKNLEGGKYQTYNLTLGNKLDKSDDYAFFLKSGLRKLDGGDYYRLSFNSAFHDILKPFETYQIVCNVSCSVHQKKNKNEHRLVFQYIERIDQIESKLEKSFKILTKKAIWLRENNWERSITSQEKKDQEQEIKEINKSIETLSSTLLKNKTTSENIVPVLNKLKKIQKKLIALKVKPNSLFPSSMSFVQNPNYQGVHKLYKEIRQLSGIDEQLFVGLEETENIGILNTSLIYERWCFLQIIKILIDKFKFLPEKNWKQKLLNQIINNESKKIRNVEISFENEDTCRKIKLWYEKVLSSGKRPDFVIDLTSDFDPNEPISKRMVLDAKFKEKINDEGGISYFIDELYNVKDYSESGSNKVFILHPSPVSVPELNTPQEWAKDTYLGETKLFDWHKEDLPDHRYGAVFLSPIENAGKYLDNLQMCIGMFLQYGIEEENRLEETEYDEWISSQSHVRKDSGINPMTKEKIFCLVCGNHEYYATVKQTPRGIKWEIECHDCHHKTYYNYCSTCRNRLIKHGPYWTYHATQSLEPYNVKCPKCGEIAIKMEE